MENFLYDFYAAFVDRSLLDDLYDETLLTPLTLALLFITLGGAVTYYFFLDQVRHAKISTWLTVLLTSAGLSGLVALVTCFQKAGQELPRQKANPDAGFFFDQGGGVFFLYALTLFLLSTVLFFLLSLLLRMRSSSVRRIPF